MSGQPAAAGSDRGVRIKEVTMDEHDAGDTPCYLTL